MNDFDHYTNPARRAPAGDTARGEPAASETAASETATSEFAAGSTNRSDTERFLDEAQRLLRSAWDAAARLVRKGNRRRLTLRSRTGETWVRMPLTLAVLLGLLLLPYWPLLVVLVVIGFAVGAQLSVERHAGGGPTDETEAPNGAA